MNYRNFYPKIIVSKKIRGFGAYVLFGGLGILGPIDAYNI
jgi:hypothetical protein